MNLVNLSRYGSTSNGGTTREWNRVIGPRVPSRSGEGSLSDEVVETRRAYTRTSASTGNVATVRVADRSENTTVAIIP